MSTRSTTTLEWNGQRVQLYRHHDGYFEGGAGETIQDLVASDPTRPDELLRRLVSMRYPRTTFEPEDFPGRLVYEWTGSEHGDLEYMYRVRWTDDPNTYKAVPELHYCHILENGEWSDWIDATPTECVNDAN